MWVQDRACAPSIVRWLLSQHSKRGDYARRWLLQGHHREHSSLRASFVDTAWGTGRVGWSITNSLAPTTREYMHWTTSIEPKWLAEVVSTFFKVAGTGGTMSKD